MLRSAARAGRRLPAALLFFLAVAAAGCGAGQRLAVNGHRFPDIQELIAPEFADGGAIYAVEFEEGQLQRLADTLNGGFRIAVRPADRLGDTPQTSRGIF